jgi:predicted permease
MVIVRELRSAVRVLLSSPGFLALGSVMVAAGIAATTFVFTVVNGVLIKDSRLPDLTNIVNISLTKDGQSRPDFGLTGRRFAALIAGSPRSVSHISAVRHLQLALEGGSRTRIVMAESVTRDYFGLLRVRPVAGRPLNAADDDPSACCSVVVSYRVALEEFGTPDRAVGQDVRLSGWPFRIIGVTGGQFRGLTFPTVVGADLWITQQSAMAFFAFNPDSPSRVFARLGDQSTIAAAKKELRAIGSGIDPDPEIGLTALPAEAAVMPTGAVRAGTVLSAALLGLSVLILVAGVSNLTNLCAVRVARRTTEFAVRLALGARRIDLAYLFISEVLLVTLCGALMGWPLAVWAARAVGRAALPEISGIVVNVDLEPDLRVAVFAVALTVITTIAVSLAVIKRVLDSESISVLARGVNVGLATWQRRSLKAALTVQVASAVVLLVPAGLFLRSAVTKAENLPQLRLERALIGRFDFRLQHLAEESGQARSIAVLEHATRSSAVTDAALATDVPIDGKGSVITLGLPGESGGVRARQLAVSPTFFEFLGIDRIRGRAFLSSDTADSENVVILSHSAATALWGQDEPIGRRVRVGSRGEIRTVVGVVADVDESAPAELRRYAYLAQQQTHDNSLALLIRLRDATPQGVEDIRNLVREADPGLALIDATTLREYVGLAADASKTAAILSSIMASVAWLICLGGVYAVAEHGSSARRHEFGMRVALGATRIGIVQLVLQQAAPAVVRGVLTGWLAAFSTAALLHAFWISTVPWDWATLLGIPLLAAMVCFGAAAMPAWRASGVSPKDALHR